MEASLSTALDPPIWIKSPRPGIVKLRHRLGKQALDSTVSWEFRLAVVFPKWRPMKILQICSADEMGGGE
ncbi:MAG TPA: hypothetical protein VLE20_15355, partial [Blastocatellia bacterium]|nr:hypothetical protein [Blastocatellia bacterium]